jgi:2-dehydro-3-deoxyphosphogluconate aldolase/(4S)-4-hydroxy-2-oxoglutarate aldolase
MIAAIRASSVEDAMFASEAVFTSGIPIVEITVTTPHATQVISQLARANPLALVGAGTVLDIETARACLDSGASFLTSTGFDLELVQFAIRQNISVIPGALTPTEVMMAQKAGANYIKIFPCSHMGGPSYVRTLRGPFPEIRLVASGGVNQQTAAEYITAGADVLGIGRELLPPEAIRDRDLNWINELARRYLHIIKLARLERLARRG